MHYQFRFRNTAGNLLRMAMYTTYTSFVGVINAVFTAAMGVLSIYAYQQQWLLVLPFSILLFFFFPVIQPILIYRRMQKNLQKNQEETIMSFDEKRIYITVGEKHDTLSWEQIRSVQNRPWQVALYTNAQHGYVIPKDCMDGKKEEFFRFAEKQVERFRKKA